MNKTKTVLQQKLLRVSRLHFFYAALLALQIIIYDAWKLITPDAVLKRWVAVGILSGIIILVWYLSHSSSHSQTVYSSLTWLLIVADIALASYYIYLQRGMASKAVALYAIPIITAGILLKRSALYTTAALCLIAYVLTSLSYFILNFNEGYKIELYGEVLFYGGIFIITAGLVWSLLKKVSSAGE